MFNPLKVTDGTNGYNKFVPEDGEAHEMEKLNSKQYGTTSMEVNDRTYEKSSEFSPGNPFIKQNVRL